MTSIVTAPALENALRDHLDTWLPWHLARVADQEAMPRDAIPRPRAVVVVSDFDPAAHEAPPMVFVESTGTTESERSEHGVRKVYRFEVAVTMGGRDEQDARRFAALTLAAINLALEWHPSIGGLTDSLQWGREEHNFDGVGRGARAVYGAEIFLGVPRAVRRRPDWEPPAPPSDPLSDPDEIGPLDTPEITVTLTPQTTPFS